MTKIPFILLLACFYNVLQAQQNKERVLELGYFTPYLSNYGVSAMYLLSTKHDNSTSSNELLLKRRLGISSGFAYFIQPGVSHNFLPMCEFAWLLRGSAKRFTLVPSAGAGYLLSFQKQEGSLNLASGEIAYRNELTHAILPQIAIQLSYRFSEGLGFYLKPFYGRNLRFRESNSGFFGLSAGLSMYF